MVLCSVSFFFFFGIFCVALSIFDLQNELKRFYSPVLGAELKIDMASFPSGTGVEWPVVGISLVPIPSSDYTKNSRILMDMNSIWIRMIAVLLAFLCQAKLGALDSMFWEVQNILRREKNTAVWHLS